MNWIQEIILKVIVKVFVFRVKTNSATDKRHKWTKIDLLLHKKIFLILLEIRPVVGDSMRVITHVINGFRCRW